MLVTNVRQQRAIGRAAAAAGGYFQLARRLSQAQAERNGRDTASGGAVPGMSESQSTRR